MQMEDQMSKTMPTEPIQSAHSNVLKRTILTLIMVALFFYIVYNDKSFLTIFIILIHSFVFREVINVATLRRRVSFLTKYLIFHFFVAANLFMLNKSINGLIIKLIPEFERFYILFAFSYYVLGFCIFTFSLRKKSIKDQFTIFAVTHVTIFYLTKTVQVAIENLNKSKFWFVFPVTLIVINDIGAYITGKLFGKTPLLKISPKKTWEGFVGGFLFTWIFGFSAIFLTLKYQLVSQQWLELFKEPLLIHIFTFTYKIYSVYLHAFFFILFGSFIAPFGGFFASGYKRLFKVKDFGTLLPGHGGFADRMDCQFIMAIFTKIYLDTFFMYNISGVEKTVKYIQEHLTTEQIEQVIEMLKNAIEIEHQNLN